MTVLSSLSRRERRIVLAGGVTIAFGVLGGRVLPEWIDSTRAARASAVRATRVLVDARRVAGNLAVVQDSLVARNGRYLALAASLLTGETLAGAGASLASLVSGAAAGAGLEMGAIQISVDTTAASVFGRPSVRGDARGDVAGVTRFLVALERGPQLLRVRQLSITQPDPGAGPEKPEALRVEFVVDGLAINRAAVEARLAAERGERSSRPRADR